MGRNLENNKIEGLINKHLIAWEVLIATKELTGIHPAGEATPGGIIEILKNNLVPVNWLLYGTAAEKRRAVSVIRLFYVGESLKILEDFAAKFSPDNPQGPYAQIEDLRALRTGLYELISNLSKDIAKTAAKKPKTHKQSREYMHTVKRTIGRGDNLFTMPADGVFIERETPEGRNKITSTAAVLGMEIQRLVQEQGAEVVTIYNLRELANRLQIDKIERLKIALLELGGFVRPLVYLDPNKERLAITMAQLYEVTFYYDNNTEAKTAVELKGTGLSYFIKNQPVDFIEIKPHPKILASLQGKGGKKLGVVLVKDEIIQAARSLSDMALRLLTYTSTNMPEQAIGKNKLYKYENLNLEEEIKTQGEPRVLESIKRALDELVELQHLESWSLENDIFRFKYGNKYVLHPAQKRKDAKEIGENQG